MKLYTIYKWLCHISVLIITAIIISSCTWKKENRISGVTVFPLKVSDNKHFLTDQNGIPFLIGGDSPWELPYKLTQEEQIAYIDSAVAIGFNTFLLEALHFEKKPFYPNRYGETPFLKYINDSLADFTTPNPAFFNRLHWLIQQLRDRQVLTLLVVADFSSYGPYWYDDVIANDDQVCYQYARYLGDLLKDCPNIIWIQGGDCDPDRALSMTEAMAQGILDSDHPSKVQTYHASHRPSSDLFPHTDWMTVNNTYEYEETLSHGGPAYTHCYHDYFIHSGKPTFDLESGYEGESNDGKGGLPERMRRQGWYAMLAGSCGHVYGSTNWRIPQNWKEIQRWPGAKHINVCFNYLRSIDWWSLVPDSGHYLIPVDYSAKHDYKIAAITENGELLVAYIPPSGHNSVTINLGALNGKITSARWLDPANGNFTGISGTPFKNNGTRTFITPGNNSFGNTDWVFELSTKIIVK